MTWFCHISGIYWSFHEYEAENSIQYVWLFFFQPMKLINKQESVSWNKCQTKCELLFLFSQRPGPYVCNWQLDSDNDRGCSLYEHTKTSPPVISWGNNEDGWTADGCYTVTPEKLHSLAGFGSLTKAPRHSNGAEACAVCQFVMRWHCAAMLQRVGWDLRANVFRVLVWGQNLPNIQGTTVQTCQFFPFVQDNCFLAVNS